MTLSELQNILFLDIETAPLIYDYQQLDATAKELWNRKWSYQKDCDPAQQYQKAGIYAEFAAVICIGFGYFRNNQFHVSSISGDNEKELLQKFSAFLSQNFNSEKHLLCAHNGKEFDFPFLCRRMVVHSLPFPDLLKIQGKKPWEIKHFDTMEMWKFGDYKNFSSLNLLAHILNIPSPKDDMDGSMVAATYHVDKDLPRISRYCVKDVITLARVFGRFNLMPELKEDQINFM